MSSKRATQKKFDEALQFTNNTERVHFAAEMIHLDIMHEVECMMKQVEMNKTELARLMGVSKGYLTQLFCGEKLMNLKTLAKLQHIFNCRFDIRRNKDVCLMDEMIDGSAAFVKSHTREDKWPESKRFQELVPGYTRKRKYDLNEKIITTENHIKAS